MQKVKNLLSLSVAAMSIAALSSCSDEDFGYTSADIAYKHNFEKAFGKVDPNQDWNLVAQLAQGRAATRAAGSKTTPAGEFNISVLPENQAALIPVDKMKDYSKMLPESNLGGAPYDKTNLGRVTQNFSVTTSKVILYPVYWWTNATDEIGLYYYDESDQIVMVPITTSHPEELECGYEGSIKIDYWRNYKDSWTNFWVNNFIFDELASSDSFKDKYKVIDGAKKVFNGSEFIEAKDYSSDNVFNDLCTLNPEKYFVVPENDMYKDEWGYDIYKDEKVIVKELAGHKWTSVSSVLTNWRNDLQKVDPVIEAAQASDKIGGIYPNSFRSKGIVVELPSSMKIGFYVKNGSNIMYSEGKLNPKMTWAGHTEEDQCYVATYESGEVDAQGNPIRYLAFEDWYNSGDFDLNDIVFRVYGFEEIHDEEETTEEGLLVCEDLGNFDFDFNDVVLKLKWSQHVKKTYNKDQDGNVTSVTINGEEQTFTITPMAAGGEYESTVKYNDQTIGEIHNLLAGNAPSIINAGETFGREGLATNYVLDNSTWNSTSYPNGYVSQVFGEGLITIAVENGTTAERLINSTNYNTKGVPQMMLLPVSFEWPQENQEISTVYTGFTNWVSDATATDWISNHTNKVTKR